MYPFYHPGESSLISAYRPPCQNQKYFVENVEIIIDFHTKSSEKLLILGDLNMEVHGNVLKTLIQESELYNLIKSPTCFKALVVDVLTYYYFSDYHHIYTILKTTYVKKEPKIITYRNYEKLS